MYTVLGSCSICGGTVTAPMVWHGIIPPTPTCTQCGAIAAAAGKVIPMIPNPTRQTWGPYSITPTFPSPNIGSGTPPMDSGSTSSHQAGSWRGPDTPGASER